MTPLHFGRQTRANNGDAEGGSMPISALLSDASSLLDTCNMGGRLFRRHHTAILVVHSEDPQYGK